MATNTDSLEIGSDAYVPPHCDDHKSHPITTFCEGHETLICDVCSTMAHRKCIKTALRDKSSKMSKIQLDNMVTRMKQIKNKIETLRSSRGKDAALLIQQANQSINDVKEFRRKINEKLNNLEKDAFKAIEDVKKSPESEMRDHITTCENTLKQVDESIKEMQECQASMNKEIMFIGLTKSSGKVEDMEKIAEDIESEATQCQLTFNPSKVLEEILQQLKELGHVITTSQRTATPIGGNVLEMTVSSKQDISINLRWVTGSTFLPNGDLVLCDIDKDKLHLYSPTFNPKDNVDLPSGPSDVCTVADTEVAVTLPGEQKIQFVSVQPRLRVGKSLKVGRKCWGIDCHGGMMYVTCHNNPYNGEVLVMTMDGQIQRRLGVEDQGRYMFTCPYYVRVSSTSGRVYLSNSNTNNVTCLSQAGDLVYTYSHEDLSDPRGIHVDSQDNILVCGRGSNNIHRVDKHGTHQSILVSESDGVVRPCCISYRNTDGAFLVGMSSKHACKVFWLKK